MTRRKSLALCVLALWLAGLGVLTRHEVFPSEDRRRERGAFLVEPVSYYYIAEYEGRHVGYATSQLDTSILGVTLRYSIVTPQSSPADSDRAPVQYTAQLSPRLRLNDFTVNITRTPWRQTFMARTVADSLLEIRNGTGPRVRADTVLFSRTAVTPEVAPLVLALGRTLRTGDQHQVQLFDRDTRSLDNVLLQISADSMFVIADSAVMDSTEGRFVPAHLDTVRSWMMTVPGSGGGTIWFDRSGRIVLHELATGLTLRRAAFELAFENWRIVRGTAAPADLPDPRRPRF